MKPNTAKIFKKVKYVKKSDPRSRNMFIEHTSPLALYKTELIIKKIICQE